MNDEILELAEIICKGCFDKNDSVFDCIESEKPCYSAKKHAENIYKAGYRKVVSVCPVCGKEMDTTEHSRQYCKECEEKWKNS